MKKIYFYVLFFILCLSIFSFNTFAQLNISTTNPIIENFDGIGTSGTATLPSNWKVDKNNNIMTVGSYSSAGTATEKSGGNNLNNSASNGIYNFGAGDAGTATDRAIGWLSSTSATKSGNLYVYLKNQTGNSLTGLTISYKVEKYRNGSNTAGFSIRMYYSTDGQNWTEAGQSFITSFNADADNNGYTSAPGVTVNVTQNLVVNIPNNSDFYLAWNYSVTSGTTTSNAQALAVDDVSILGLTTTIDTPPSITGVTVPSCANLPLENENFNITATITDNNAVASAKIYYIINDGATDSVAMTGSKGQYTGSIPASAYGNGDRVKYWISAKDNAGNVTTTESNAQFFFAGITPISALKPVDTNGVLLYLNYYARIEGIATVGSGIFSSTNLQVYIQDNTAGICLYKGSNTTAVTEGHKYRATGKLIQFNGLAEIVPDDPATNMTDLGAQTMPNPLDITIANLLANPENYEGKLIKLTNVTKTAASAPWPNTDASANMTIVNTGTQDSLTLRIESSSNMDGTTEPAWPQNIVGIFNQYDTTSPYTSGYRISPRYMSDFTNYQTNDTTPPVISNIAVSNITANSATITWTTDEPSDSKVKYGTTQGNLTSEVTNSSLVTTHSITLTNLTGGTTYYYQVVSKDAASNTATSAVSSFQTPLEQVALPTFNPPAGTYTGTQTVTISCATQGASIYYTLDGTDPDQTAYLYLPGTTILNITQNITIKARAYKTGMLPSEIAVASYIINTPPAPVIVVYPLNNATNVPVNSALVWQPSPTEPLATSYKVYLDTQNPPATVVASGTTFTNYIPFTGLNYNTKYYWKVVPKAGNISANEADCPVYTFTTENQNAVTNVVLWNFNDQNVTADAGIPANLTKNLTSNFGTITFTSGFYGTNDKAANIASGWDNGANTKYWQVEFVTTGYHNLTLSSKQRSSSTGPRDFKIQYSIDSKTWNDVIPDTIKVGNNWNQTLVINVNLPAACNNKPKVLVRWIMASNISVDGATVASTGTSRIDDILVRGNEIPPDTTPPVISNVSVSNIGVNNATISWTTDENADSKVMYGLSANNLNQSVSDANFVLNHSLILNNLLAGTTYFYKVMSKDQNNNQGESQVSSFTTEQLIISNISVSNVTSSSATINWTTNIATNSKVIYGITPNNLIFEVSNASYVTTHSLVLTGLTNGVTYYYKIISKDIVNNQVESNVLNFVTNLHNNTAPSLILSSTFLQYLAGNVSLSINTPIVINGTISDPWGNPVASAKLYYRTIGTTVYTSINGILSKETQNPDKNVTWTIPGSAAVAPGLEIYFELSDNELTSYYPSYNYINEPLCLPIGNYSPSFSNADIPDYEMNTNLTISLDINDSNGIQSVILNYRPVGSTNYTSTNMTLTNKGKYTATIPANAVGQNGVEYYIVAKDNTGVRSYYGTPDTPKSILPPYTTKVGWNMLSIPYDISTIAPSAIFGDDFTSYFEWSEKYNYWTVPLKVQLGKGYIAYAEEAGRGVAVNGNVLTNSLNITLSYTNHGSVSSSGWNLIGNPYKNPISFTNNVVNKTNVEDRFWWWDPTTNSYLSYNGPNMPFGGLNDTLKAWQGVWVHATGTNASLTVNPAVKNNSNNTELVNNYMTIKLTGENIIDQYNYIGISQNENMDVYKLTPLSNKYAYLYFNKNNSRYSTAFSKENNIIEWNMTVETNYANTNLVLNFDNVTNFAKDYKLTLIDMQTGNVYDLRNTNSIYILTGNMPKGEINFAELISNPIKERKDGVCYNFIIKAEKLTTNINTSAKYIKVEQNSPNPFNPTTTISFELPENANVKIAVYNILGQEVKVLADKEYSAGINKVVWDGKDKDGNSLPSGVYFYKVTSFGKTITKKMVMIK